MKRTNIGLIVLLLTVTIILLGNKKQILCNNRKYFKEDNTRIYVPDEKTAIAIAEAVLLPILGDKIARSRPFVATLDNAKLIWTVEGTLNAVKGGVPHIEIQRKDGKILGYYHSK